MLRSLLLAALLLNTCSCLDEREPVIDGSRIEDESHDSSSASIWQRKGRAYHPLHDETELHNVEHTTTYTNTREASSSTIDQDMVEGRRQKRKAYDPLQTLDEEQIKPHYTEENTNADKLVQESTAHIKEEKIRSLATHPRDIPYRLFQPSTISLSYILSQKALRKECHLVTLELIWDSLQQSRETSWMVTLGTLDDLQDKNVPNYVNQENSGGGTVIEYSHNQYYQLLERHSFCLPGEGVFTFTIFDWGGDGLSGEEGRYTLYSSDRRPIITGKEFNFMESKKFILPLPRLATETPSVSPAPSVSIAPTMDCDWIEIDILYDMYPEETTWMVIRGDYSSLDSGNITIIEESTIDSGLGEGFTVNVGGAGGTSMKRMVCLPGEGTYSFVIFDSYYNGICCEFGDGSYTITAPSLPGEILGQGGKFTTFDIATFEVPFVRAPSSSPSTSPKPSISNAPSVDCKYVELELRFDEYSSETSWVITKQDGANDISVAESTFYADPDYGGIYTILSVCLPGDGIYTFKIEDKAGDGICCFYGEGFYTLTYKGEGREELKIVEGADFSYEQSTTFVVPYGTTTLAPTVSPAPSTKCYNVEVSVTFDRYPYETIWLIVKGEYGSGLSDDDSLALNTVVESPKYNFGNLNSTDSHIECLPEGTYTFLIVDSDGICCAFGDGGYTVTVTENDGNEVTVKQGGDFKSLESVTFDLPFVPMSSPTIPPESDVSQNQNSASMWPTPVQDLVSSLWPTPSSSSPPVIETTAPTSADCMMVHIELYFDAFPYDTQWWLVQGDLNAFENKKPKFIGKSPRPYDVERLSNVTHSFCLGESQYSFMIFDDNGNGMCCKSGDGYYRLSYGDDNMEFAKGGKFGFFDVIVFEVPFPTRSPSWTPIPTTAMPTSYSPSIDTPAPSAEEKCDVLLDLTRDTDGDQNAIRWEVALGDQSSVDNAYALIVAQSEKSTYSISRSNGRSVDSDKVCLPGEGRYTFTIFDSNTSGDTRYRLVVNGTLVAYGSGFGLKESTTFSVPGTGQPTPAPQLLDPSPTSADCTMIDISVTFDDFPDESYWVVYQGDSEGLDDSLIVANSPYYLNMTQNITSEQVCLPGNGEYTFVMYDVASDGMCCNFGKGGYVVSAVDAPFITIAEGGEFNQADITTFSVPIMIAPSTSPTITPQPTESQSPTLHCSAVELTVTFDVYPSETVWTLYDADNNTVAESPFYPNIDFANETIKENFCLPDGTYIFLLTDQAGDGNCCVGLGDGSYSIVYQGGNSDAIIVDKGPDPTFVYYDSTEFTIPYVVPPTKRPTISPAPTTSLPPTSSCIQMEVIINFDAYPADTLWEITVGDTNSWDNNNAILAVDSPIYSSIDMFSTVTHSICLPGDETYTFSVFDGTGNGMCCDEGTGGFILLMLDDDGNREIIAEGAEFEWRQSTLFDLPISAGPRIGSLRR